MEEYRAFPATNGPDSSVNDGEVNIAMDFRVRNASLLTQAWFYRGTTSVNPDNVRVYRITNVGATAGEVVVESTPTFSGTGWQATTFAEPVEVVPGNEYRVVFHMPAGSHITAATASYFNGSFGGIVNGALVVPSVTMGPYQKVAQGVSNFKTGALGFPSTTFNGNNYWLDITVTGIPDEYRIWPLTNGGSSGDDTAIVNLGTEFYVTQTCWVKRVYYYHDSGSGIAPPTAALWEVNSATAGTLVGGANLGTFETALIAGWQTLTLPEPVQIVANQRYRIAALFPSKYPATAHYWSTGAGNGGHINGPLVAPNATEATGGGQGSFLYQDSIGYPENQFNQTNYWVDVAISDTSLAPLEPTVNAGNGRPVLNGGSVVLDAQVDPPEGETITAYSWTVETGGGSLADATTAAPTYTAPDNGEGVAIIRCTATASNGADGSDVIRVAYASNIIVAENKLPGTSRSIWDLAHSNFGGMEEVQGFCDGFSVNKDEVVSFKIAQSDTGDWAADVYRLGYYGENEGARLIESLTPTAQQLSDSRNQPVPLNVDPGRTKPSLDCGNWTETLHWTPPAWAVSGVYILRIRRVGGGVGHIIFVLRDDEREADIMMMPADSTWQAYNAFGGLGADLLTGNSLYYGVDVNQYELNCARFISYNRPIVNRIAANVGQAYGAVEYSNFFTSEYNMVRFLERNGYDVKYYGCIDAAGDPEGDLLRPVKVAMMVGHSEYWSDHMRAGWEAAKQRGTSVFSCSGNEVYWRLVGSDLDASGRPRTWECQKTTINGRGAERPEWTGAWRDPDGFGEGGGRPENLLTGTIFVVNGPDFRELKVPFEGGYSKQPLWRLTAVADITQGEWISPPQILGFEWDTFGPDGVTTGAAEFLAEPHAQARFCSRVTYNINAGMLLTDAGDVYDAAGAAEHRLVVQPSGTNGGITFGTGTVNWSFGLESANTYQIGGNNTSTPLRQATVNILRDMGVVPASLMAGLVVPDPVEWFSPSDAASTGFFGVLDNQPS
ncbi:DUF4082 domain-containing protein [Candidatus Saccharibacteria bacterium]|nr:DUF4082 domain-containing protein [Candidatus Saccharibacteria bacterium]